MGGGEGDEKAACKCLVLRGFIHDYYSVLFSSYFFLDFLVFFLFFY